jgi:hypothetical protein
MSLFEGLGANAEMGGHMGGHHGRQDCRDCGVHGQVIPAAPVAIPESPFVPPKLPGGAPIVITRPGPVLPPPMLPPPPMPPSPVNVQPPFAPMPIVEPRPEPSPRLPSVTNGDVFPHSIPMVAHTRAKRQLPCC